MKISKLFHWLYAFVMFLPIFAIGVTCGYAMFNKNAYQSYAGYTGKEEHYTAVTSFNDLVDGQTYRFNLLNGITSADANVWINYESLNVIDTNINQTYIDALENSERLHYWWTGSLNSNYFNANDLGTNLSANSTYLVFDFVFNSYNMPANYTGTLTDYFGNQITKTVITTSNTTIDNVFYYSVDKVTENPLFSWSYNSFLVAPFSYIAVLFSMPANSPIVMLLSYWLAISIIWLTFDVIMYVPLLVHRWLDKGVID